MSLDLSKVLLTRASGTSNTFIFAQGADVRKEDRKRLVSILCGGLAGFHNDGVVFIDLSSDQDFAWDFYNADGSSAEMCGNAARCAALYFNEKFIKKNKISFGTKSGFVIAEIIGAGDVVEVHMPKTQVINPSKDVRASGELIRGAHVNSGVPHFVVQAEPDEELARALRKVGDFGPAGANITFLEIAAEGDLLAVTFERGVEGFTMSCGTGAVAAAEAYRFMYPHTKNVSIEMPGGQLEVIWQDNNKGPILKGPAQLEFDFYLNKGIYEKL